MFMIKFKNGLLAADKMQLFITMSCTLGVSYWLQLAAAFSMLLAIVSIVLSQRNIKLCSETINMKYQISGSVLMY